MTGENQMKIDRLTVATTHTEEMIQFYNAVFNARLEVISGSPLYRGKLSGMELIFCPNTIVGIEAEKNRIQLRLIVDDLETVIRQAESNGGGAYGERMEEESRIGWGIHDPDGNSIELMQLK